MANNQIIVREDITDLTKPAQVVELSNTLATIVLKKGLAIDLQGKKYVLAEGWQLAGAFCGIFPITEKVENLSDENTIRYRAEVSLKDQDGNIVGSGMAICTNKEKGKERFAEYAVCSMAQTRAVSKAMRLKLGWIMKLAGFQATPYEEMGEDGVIEAEPIKKSEITKEEVIEHMGSISDNTELYKYFLNIAAKIRKDEQVIKTKDIAKQRILASNKEAKNED